MSTYINKITGNKIYIKEITAFDVRFTYDPNGEDESVFSIEPIELEKYWIKSEQNTIKI